MGLLKTITQKVSNIALKPAVALGNLATAGIEKITGQTYGRTTSKELSETTAGKILGTATAAAAVGLAAALSPAAALKVATSKPVIAVAAVATLAPKTTETVLKSEALTKTAIATAVNPLAGLVVGAEQGGSIIGTALGNVADVIKEKAPGVATAIQENAPTIGAAAAGLTAAGVIAAVALKDKAEEIPSINNSSDIVGIETAAAGTSAAVPMGNNEVSTFPQTIPTKTITTGRKKRRKAKAARSPIISNKVLINIVNKPVGLQMKRYLNQRIYA